MAPHSSTPAWRIPWMEEPGGLQSMGSLRDRYDWATSLSLFTFMHWRRKWQPTPVFLPGESQGRGSLVGCCLWGSHRVGHDWSDLAAAGAFIVILVTSLYANVIRIKWDNVCNGSIYCPAHMNNSVKGRYRFYWEKYEKCLVLCEYSINKSVNITVI